MPAMRAKTRAPEKKPPIRPSKPTMIQTCLRTSTPTRTPTMIAAINTMTVPVVDYIQPAAKESEQIRPIVKTATRAAVT